MHTNCPTQVVIGTKVGRTKHLRIMPGGALETEQSLSSSGPSSMFVGKKLDEHRGSFLLEYPMDKGHIVDGGWDAMEALWEVRTLRSWKTIYVLFCCLVACRKILMVSFFFLRIPFQTF